MATEYQLTTLRDVFEQVPADKIELCMREIAQGMVQARALHEILAATAEALTPGQKAGLEWPIKCTWIDDNKGTVTVQGVTDDSEEPLFTLESRRATRPECSGNPNDCPENEGYGCCNRGA